MLKLGSFGTNSNPVKSKKVWYLQFTIHFFYCIFFYYYFHFFFIMMLLLLVFVLFFFICSLLFVFKIEKQKSGDSAQSNWFEKLLLKFWNYFNKCVRPLQITSIKLLKRDVFYLPIWISDGSIKENVTIIPTEMINSIPKCNGDFIHFFNFIEKCTGLFQVNCALPHRGCQCYICKKFGIPLAILQSFPEI